MDEEGDESPGSTVKRSMQQLLELENLPESKAVSAEVREAKGALAAWAVRPFNIAQSYTETYALYEAIVVLLRAYLN